MRPLASPLQCARCPIPLSPCLAHLPWQVLLGAIVPVNAVGVAISTVQVRPSPSFPRLRPPSPSLSLLPQVVLLPIVVGMLANAKFPKSVKKIEPFSPIVGVLSTCILVGSAVAQ